MPALLSLLEEIDDPRQDAKCHYKLTETLFMAACAMLCGANNWEAIAFFAKARESWFREHLELENGVPSHDTFNRGISLIDPVHSSSTVRSVSY